MSEKAKKSDDPIEAALKCRIKAIFKEHESKYGSRRILEQLGSEGHQIGRYKVRRLMRNLGLKAKFPKKYKVTTDSKHNFIIAPNVLDRKFDVKNPNAVWTGDITYIWTFEGWLYLAIVMDLYSRQVVGWSMNKRMKNQLTLDALSMAYWRKKPEKGLLHHSDRGSQYACHEYQKQLKRYGMKPSMNRKGDCWDNAPTERFFRRLKTERLSDYRFITRRPAQVEVIDYISYYNSIRLHSTLGYKTPFDYEKELCRIAA
ncbi:MAG: IS3 family transposase [Thermotogota bacterium]|nr:IS3 family transposase [Thermotogota bacterium]